MEKAQIEHAVKVHGDMLYRLALVRLKNKEDAQDIVQQTFLKLTEHYSKLESEEHVKAWLIRVCNNLCTNMLRTPWRQHKVDITEWDLPHSSATSAEECALKNLQLQQFLLALSHLPDKYRTVLHLNYMENYSPKEISDILNLSYNNVCVRLNRAKKQLASILEKEDFL